MKKFKRTISAILTASFLCTVLSFSAVAADEDPLGGNNTHTHNLYYTKNKNGTHNILCNVEGCDDYPESDVPCTYDQEIVDDTYLKSSATCENKAVYYKSCICGSFETSEDATTFESGDLADHTGGTATYTEKAVCDICGQPYGKKTNAFSEFTVRNHTYGENFEEPVVTAYNGTPVITYSDSEDGSFSSTVPTNAGTYYIKAEVESTEDYDGISEVQSFEIEKAPVSISTKPNASSITRGYTLGTSDLSGGKAIDNNRDTVAGTFSWETPDKQMSNAGSLEETVIFTPSNSNYAEATCIVTVRVTRPSTTSASGSTGNLGTIALTNYLVKFDSNGGTLVANQTIVKGNCARAPIPPTRENYTFAGWYTDTNLSTAYDFSSKISNNITLYAKWLRSDVISLTVGDVNAAVFGKMTENDVPPVIRYERTMLPARFVAEALGASVDWNEEEQKVTIKKEGVDMVITINSHNVLLNGETVALDSPAFIENDRTYMPLRFICENLGAKVDWDDSTKTVTILK